MLVLFGFVVDGVVFGSVEMGLLLNGVCVIVFVNFV